MFPGQVRAHPAGIGWNGGMSTPPSMTSFQVTHVFDDSYRDGLLVSGKILTGKVEPGMMLSDRTGRQTLVIELDFLSPRDVRLGEVTFLVERGTPSPAQEDAVLTGIPITEAKSVRCAKCGGSDLRVTHARSRLPDVEPAQIECYCRSCDETSTVRF
jgi:hypothetical protein